MPLWVGSRHALRFTPVVAEEGGAAAVVTTFASVTTSTADLSTYTLSMTDMLTTGHRVIAVSGRAASVRTINSVTLDGETATILGSQINNGSSSTALFIAPATANTTGDCVVTLSAGWLRCLSAVWNVLNLESTTPTDTASATGTNPSTTIDVVADGACFASVCHSGPTTWTGLTEDYDQTPDGINMSGAHDDFAAAQTGLTVTATGTGGAPCLSVVALR